MQRETPPKTPPRRVSVPSWPTRYCPDDLRPALLPELFAETAIKPQGRDGNHVVGFGRVCRAIGLIGKAAGIKVATDPRTGKVKYASAHDLRRSFGERWSTRVMPQVLMALMRHESIETTMRYYVGRNANTTADAVWEAYRRSQEGTVLGTVAPKKPSAEGASPDLIACPIGS